MRRGSRSAVSIFSFFFFLGKLFFIFYREIRWTWRGEIVSFRKSNSIVLSRSQRKLCIMSDTVDEARSRDNAKPYRSQSYRLENYYFESEFGTYRTGPKTRKRQNERDSNGKRLRRRRGNPQLRYRFGL